MNTFKIDDLIRIAKRENNPKRSYLYVNPFQGKHVPVSPSLSIELFNELAEKIEKRYEGENLLIIGFAETATAIGSAIAYKAKNCKYYLNTTREDIPGAEYLFFTESHSHATEQRLVINGFDDCLKKIDRIVFAEDEVTTGNTIEKLIRILQEKYAKENIKFGIISILNSMPDIRCEELQEQGIICDYMYRIPAQYRIDEINHRTYEPLRSEPLKGEEVLPTIIDISGYWNSRLVCAVEVMRNFADRFAANVIDHCSFGENVKSILILGTEECMFPGILVGHVIETTYPTKTVRFHATTRSPIEVCSDEDYPLHSRIPLNSIYSEDRKTFIYNLKKYDRVLIVTDARNMNHEGLKNICAALEYYGNEKIVLIHWSDDFNEKQLF